MFQYSRMSRYIYMYLWYSLNELGKSINSVTLSKYVNVMKRLYDWTRSQNRQKHIEYSFVLEKPPKTKRDGNEITYQCQCLYWINKNKELLNRKKKECLPDCFRNIATAHTIQYPRTKFCKTTIRRCWHSEIPSQRKIVTFPNCTGFLNFTRICTSRDIHVLRVLVIAQQSHFPRF